MNIFATKSTRMAAISAAALLALTGCAGTSAPEKTTSAPAGQVVTIDDAWVKAVDSGMSGAFGVFTNAGEEDVTVVSATTDAADDVELHETVKGASGEMVMREAEDGFLVPSGGTFLLEPGANHIMLMGLSGPLSAGKNVTITVTFSDDSTYEFTAPVKDYSGANENYEDSDHEGMDH